MATHRRYTKRQKAEAVAAAMLTNATAAAEKLDIPENTLRYWLDQPEFVELRSKTRDEVGVRLWSAIQLGIDEVAKGLRSDAPLRDKATAVGILYDKHALMTGGATERTETHDWKFDDHETVERAGAIIVEELTRRSDERAAEDAVGTAGETGATPTDD